MKINFLKKMSIRYRIIAAGLVIIAAFAVTVFAYLIPSLESSIMAKKKEMIQNVTRSAVSLIEKNYDQYKKGLLSENEMEKRAKEYINAMRYGSDGKDYLWINTMEGVIVMHPYRPDLIGKDITNMKDSHGKKFMKEMVDVAKAHDTGFVDYYWQWQDQKDKIVLKISYVQAFKPLNWVLATGIYVEDVKAEIFAVKIKIMAVFAGIILVSVVFLAVFSKRITSYLLEVQEGLMDVSNGNLTTRVEVRSEDEIGRMMTSFNEFVNRIHEVIKEVALSSEQLASSSTQLSSSAESFSGNSQSQAAASEEASATIEEISGAMENINSDVDLQFNNIKTLLGGIQSLNGNIMEMRERIHEAFSVSTDIAKMAQKSEDELGGISEGVERISSGSREMVNIVKIINDISEQINLLSLNAAIEAARAGESGRGFAVVADEIGKLADETGSSLKSISDLISGNEKEILNFAQGVGSIIKDISEIVTVIEKITGMMEHIELGMETELEVSNSVRDSAQHVQVGSERITVSTSEEKTAVGEMARSIEDINLKTQAIASGSEEIAGNSRELSGLAEKLKAKVDYFRTM